MPPARVDATVRCPAPDSHLVEVTLVLPALPEATERTLVMPKWIPGSYKIRDFGRHVQDLEVTNAAGNRLVVTRTRTDGWTFRDPGEGRLTVFYRVYCRDLTVDTSHVTDSHLYIHGTTCFLYDEACRGLPWRLTVETPRGWGIWSGLPQEGGRKGEKARGIPKDKTGRAVFVADGYDHLVDCPVEAGPGHHVSKFRAGGKHHRLVVWNAPLDVPWDQVTDDLTLLIEETGALFDGLPYDHYTFIVHVAKGHGGGLEHANSTVLGVDPLHLTDKKQYETRFLPLCAHEFFHTWNVKRIRPSAFIPYDYQTEVMTKLLWLFEGFTSYYEVPLLLRSGIIDEENAYEVLAELIKYMELVPGRHKLPVSDSSRLTWVKLYQRHESNINTNVSYYSKGAVLGFVLDAHLRERGKSLDTVMRHLWRHYGKKDKGVDEDALPEIIKAATGIDLGKKLHKWADLAGDLPVDRACRLLGLDIKREHSDDKATLGLGVQLAESELKVTAVPDRWDTPGGKPSHPHDVPRPHPIDPDDELIAIDGWKVTGKDLGKHLNNGREAGDLVQVTLFRDGRIRNVDVPLVEKEPDKTKIGENKKATAAAKRRRGQWKKSRREKA
ncbi:MAG: PDZ domain-containing protein [Euryarchaeota archaeon]|nr:PDZ domain-containing protein [Euryarchaeota archaeon]